MADNVDVTPGSGATVRTKDRSGVETQAVIVDKNGGANENLGLTGSKTLATISGDDTTPVEVVAANTGRKSVLILNNSDGTVYLGTDNTVDAATGVPLTTGQSMTDTTSVDAWWVIGATGVTVDLRVVEVA